MNNNPSQSTPHEWMKSVLWLLWRLTLYVAVAWGVLVFVDRVSVMIIYIIVGIILAYIIRPMAGYLAHRSLLVPSKWSVHKRRATTSLYVLVLVFGGGYYATTFMLSPFVAQVREVSTNWDSTYKPRFEQYSEDTRAWYERTFKKDWRDKIEASFAKTSDNGDLNKKITGYLSEGAKKAGGLAHQVVEIVLLPVLAYYFAIDSKKLKHEVIGLLPKKRQREASRMIHEFNRIMHSYVIGQAILCALAGVIVGLGLWGLGVPYALTLGLLAGVTRAIPIIGPIIGGIPIIAIALVTKGIPVALAVLIFFTIMHFAESKFIMPMLIGERMDLHPVVIIIVLLIGQEFGGLLGMFFAAPIAAIIRVGVRRYWLGKRVRGDQHAVAGH